MKKFGIIALAALLVVAFTVPASAVENIFGGYWRTRFVTEQDYSGMDQSAAGVGTGNDITRVDTRTRLYYTAVFHENLKFVNKFEFDAVWGDTVLGDFGADGQIFEIKNSYVDFNLGPVNYKIGIQGGTLARGFIFADDFSGLAMTYKGEGFSIPLFWMKVYEGGTGYDKNEEDVDYFALAPTFTLGEGITLNPYIVYGASSDISGWDVADTIYYHPTDLNGLGAPANTSIDLWFWGLDVDAKFGPLSLWFTGIIENGDVDFPAPTADWDISAYLVALGGAYDMGMFDIHGEFFNASGDDDLYANDDYDAFWVPSKGDFQGQSYYWAEIMGYGIFDEQCPANTPGDKITNVWAINLGTKVKPMEKLTVVFDLWYAELDEERALNVDESLGTEADLKVSYELLEGLNLDVVAAYMWADDAVYKQVAGGASDENPYELGARLSLSF